MVEPVGGWLSSFGLVGDSGMKGTGTMAERMGDWMQTRSGVRFYVEDPRVEDVRLEDIVFALSNLTRFTGHTEFYSVAQHSVHVSELVPRELELQALLHDAAEAYCGDMGRPLKHGAALRVVFAGIEERLLDVIGEAFGVRLWPLDALVTEADLRMVATEKRDLLLPMEWDRELPAGRVERIECWDPWTARGVFKGRIEAAMGLRWQAVGCRP